MMISVMEMTELQKSSMNSFVMRLISFLNIDTKLISKVIAIRLKKILNYLINGNQIEFLYNRFISEGGWIISDIVEITDLLQSEGIMLTVNIEQSFDSANHLFLVSIYKME